MRFSPRSASMVRGSLVVAVAWAAGSLTAAAADAAIAFEKKVLTDRFHAEAAGIGDLDKDGHVDVVGGPYWYAGPTFADRFELYPPKDFDPNQYSNNFMTAVADVDGDGRLDVLVNEWPGKAVHGFRNPGDRGGSWAKYLAHPVVDNESPDWLDVTGDGRGELVFHTGGVLGFATPSEKTGTDRWSFRPCSAAEKWGQYQHGLGVGDVDGDGDADVITSLAGHGYGVSWFEQVKKEGTI